MAARTLLFLKMAEKRKAKASPKVRRPRPVVVDFETDGIEGRPAYPPKPCGVSIKYPGKRARYYGFGHVDCAHCGERARNDSTEAQAKAALKAAYRWPDGLLFQNAKFDVDVADVYWGLKVPPWQKIHDDMFLIFLDDPNQQTFSLKPSAERLLGLKPEEKDAVGEWLMKHQPVPGVRISESPRSKTYFMKYLRHAPAPLVGKYANGDVDRTEKLFDLLWEKNRKRGMLAAYDRERRLMPILLECERRGLPVHHRKLKADVSRYTGIMARVGAWVRRRLRASDELNLDSGEQLFEAMRRAKVIDRKRVLLTPTGKPQTNKEALLLCVKDKHLLSVLKYRSQLKTYLGTFMVPWLEMAEASAVRGLLSAAMRREGKSLVFTSWNQVKGDARGGSAGARTGRLSASLFMNVPKVASPVFSRDEARLPKEERKGLPACPVSDLPPLPNVRSYVAPFPGDVLIDRDYSQQEPRILAHFDGGAILKMYLDDPWMDFHDRVREELAKAGLHYARKPVKNTGLGLIYGMGIGLLAERTGLSIDEAKRLKAAILRILVGLRQMYQECRRRAQAKEPVKTWAGREYHCEPPRLVDGRFRTFDYKLVNVLIQGSAADCTKEAILRYDDAKGPNDKLLLNVHDQLTASVPKARWAAAMEVMRKTMESVEFDVEMLTEGSMSAESWAALEDTDKRGRPVGRFARKAA